MTAVDMEANACGTMDVRPWLLKSSVLPWKSEQLVSSVPLAAHPDGSATQHSTGLKQSNANTSVRAEAGPSLHRGGPTEHMFASARLPQPYGSRRLFTGQSSQREGCGVTPRAQHPKPRSACRKVARELYQRCLHGGGAESKVFPWLWRRGAAGGALTSVMPRPVIYCCGNCEQLRCVFGRMPSLPCFCVVLFFVIISLRMRHVDTRCSTGSQGPTAQCRIPRTMADSAYTRVYVTASGGGAWPLGRCHAAAGGGASCCHWR